MMKEAQKKEVGVRRKWQRANGKENSNLGNDGNQKPESSYMGKKRQWKLQDKEKEYSESCYLTKRRKGQQESMDAEMRDVVLASLKWA